MLRVCSWCSKHLGERCRGCGHAEPVGVKVHLYLPDGFSLPGLEAAQDERLATYVILPLWQCPQCYRAWIKGMDGVTHGMCPECAAKNSDKLIQQGGSA